MRWLVVNVGVAVYWWPVGYGYTIKGLHPELLGSEDTIVDFPEGKVDMDLFNLINVPNHTNVKTRTRPHAANEVPFLTGGGAEDQVQDKVAYEIPPTGNASATGVALETRLEKEVTAMGPKLTKGAAKESTHGGKSLASMGLDAGSLLSMPAAQDPSTATKSLSDPKPLCYVNPLSHLEKDIAQSSKGTTTEILTKDATTAVVNIQVGRDNDCRLDAPDVCQDIVDHIIPSRYFYKLRHLPNADFPDQYNITLARQVAMGLQLRLRFEQEVRLLKSQTKKLKTLLEAEVNIKKSAEAKNAELVKELDSLRAQFSNLQAVFEKFKKYEDDKVEQRCVKMDAHLDKLSVDFDEELYPHMLPVIAGHQWVIGHDLRLAVMKCAKSSEIRQAFADVVSVRLTKGMSKGMKYGIEHEVRDLEDLWAVKEEMLLEDAIAAKISRAKKKKKCMVVCLTHEIGSAHHARSDGIPVSTPTVPQGLAILLVDAATQT
uniref:Transposase (Putative), gypsy type n=1 Tax=Tanacetum cinerariifolium TaxID=118510 RepID=A0A6L2L409_TANCI|nr:hypothetical protein [Tanacetum cinerariifolium]